VVGETIFKFSLVLTEADSVLKKGKFFQKSLFTYPFSTTQQPLPNRKYPPSIHRKQPYVLAITIQQHTQSVAHKHGNNATNP
jgi:hypothetical protein